MPPLGWRSYPAFAPLLLALAVCAALPSSCAFAQSLPGTAKPAATEAPKLDALTPQWWQFLEKAEPGELATRGEQLIQQLPDGTAATADSAVSENLREMVQQSLTRYIQTVNTPATMGTEPLPEGARSNFAVLRAVMARFNNQAAEQRLLTQRQKAQRLRQTTLQTRLDRNWQQYRTAALTAPEKLETAARIISTRLLRESEAIASDYSKNRIQELHDLLAADRRRWQQAAKKLQASDIPESALPPLQAEEPSLQRQALYASRALSSAELKSLLPPDPTVSSGTESADNALIYSVKLSAQWRRNQAEQLFIEHISGQLEKQIGREQLELLRGSVSLLQERSELLPQTGGANLLPTLQALEAAESWSQAAGLRIAPPRFGVRLQNIWQQTSEKLSATLFRVGEAPVTTLMLFRALLLFIAGLVISSVVRRGLLQLGTGSGFNATTLYTLGRLSHYIIIIVALFMALASIGLNFGNLALVAGALSVGIGFGLQAIVSNFVSGLILLLDRSLKVGDYIELDSGISGTVKEIRVRSTLVTSNDNVDVLVPNSEFVNGRVMNWTHGDQTRRLHIEFQTAYGSDKKVVNEAVMAIVPNVAFTLKSGSSRAGSPKFYPVDKAPSLWFMGYGDSCMNFELIVWINATGIARPSGVIATYRWAIDDALKAAGIVIPHRQRHIVVDGSETSAPPPASDAKPAA